MLTLTAVLEVWVLDAERMQGSDARRVVVTNELFDELVHEQGRPDPTVGDLPVLRMASELPAAGDLPALREMVEIEGPDRVSIYVGEASDASTHPIGLDPAMPVVFVPLVLDQIADPAQLEMYNRLRWYGLSPDEALAGSRQ